MMSYEGVATFGAVIQTVRMDRGWTQTDLAAAAQVSISTVQKLEALDVLPDNSFKLPKVARALDLSVEELTRRWREGRNVVAIELSREVYDSVKAAADYHQAGIEEWISMTAGTHKVTAPGKPPVNPRPPKASARRAGTHRRTPR